MTTHRVEIFGQSYTLKADVDTNHVLEVAQLVDRKMREVAEDTRSVSTAQIAVLAALDIASEYLQRNGQDDGVTEEVARRCQAMIRRMDDRFSDVQPQPTDDIPCCVRDSDGSC